VRCKTAGLAVLESRYVRRKQRALAFPHFEGRRVYVTSAGNESCSKVRSIKCGAAGSSGDNAQKGAKGLENKKMVDNTEENT